MKKIIYQVLFLLFIPFLSFSQEPAKLLTSTKFNNGEPIPEAKTSIDWEKLSMSNQPVFMKKIIDGYEYYFYNWYAITDIRGVVDNKFMIPDQYMLQIWNAYSPLPIEPIGIISEQGYFTKVSDQQYFWTTSEYFEKSKYESAVSVSISRSNTGEAELKQAYKQEGLLVLEIQVEKFGEAVKKASLLLGQQNKTNYIETKEKKTITQTINSENVSSNEVILPIQKNTSSSYNSIKIGNQIWMTENLNVDRFRNGDLIPEAKTADEWEKAGIDGKPAWCYYNNNSTIGAKYGKLYNWFAVSDPRGLAPIGWHLPSDQEWINLKNHLVVDPGKKMKSTSDWNGNGNGNNESGFAGKPAGYRHKNGMFYLIGDYGYWWSFSEYDENNSWNLDLHYNHSFTNRNYNNKSQGFSVRCIKD
jgi:uncharacterized protein (TIGR02145 family)